jgi:hypothetical protein
LTGSPGHPRGELGLPFSRLRTSPPGLSTTELMVTAISIQYTVGGNLVET